MTSNGISLGWTEDKYLNILTENTNNKDFFELSSLSYPSFLFFHAGVLYICLFLLWLVFSYFVSYLWLIIVQVVISSKVRAIEVIHIPMWSIIIYVSTQCYNTGFCLRILCPYHIEGQLPLGLIADSFWAFVVIEDILASTYKTATIIHSESSGEIIFLIMWLRSTFL